MAIPLVRTIESPTRAPAVEMALLAGASPSIAPHTMGLGRPIVTSVCPPTNSTPSSPAASRIWSKMAAAPAESSPSGRSTVARNQRGVPPLAATSLAFTLTAYQPIRSVANVTGSALAMRVDPPNDMWAASSPTPGPTSTRGSFERRSASICLSRLFGSFPGLSWTPMIPY